MNLDDTETFASTSAASISTPPTSTVMTDDHGRSHNYQVPWPGNTYMIVQKGTDRAITLTSTGLQLQDIEQDPEANNHWQCIESNNYIGFYNQKFRVYMGHDGRDGVRATSLGVDGTETAPRWGLSTSNGVLV
ncbi:hypothetical protein N0V84_007471 [Fusarium piperis]|uniref:Uncharacterized protein n=1 Tax=Fusarium piperis TaxID=1435070 RepID=A0A9W9BNB7_9HYPO|nr:hypothetical protein N0V84_007471 [Fusarium piperis]